MPWSETSPMDQRTHFLSDYLRGVDSVAGLARTYGISRKTAYKWVRRYADEGAKGLEDRSRRPHSCSHQTQGPVIDALVQFRRLHPTWGPKKLLDRLVRKEPSWPWPAPSTASRILKDAGLVRVQRRRSKPGHPGEPSVSSSEPNAVWSADFKGQFRTRDGLYCYPLTISDGCSRFLLACQALPSTAHYSAKAVFESVFREFGLPMVMLTDNGGPFATTAIARLSALSVWWIRLGIRPALIELGKPQQNGRHERMHRTLKDEATRPPAGNRTAQQRRFNAFRNEFNFERPHEALSQETPASLYQPSTRPFPDRLPEIEYAGHFEVRLVSRNGGIRWNSEWVDVSYVLAG